MKHLILIFTIFFISPAMANRADSIITHYQNLFKTEMVSRGINADSINVVIEVKNIRWGGSYGQCIRKKDSKIIIVVFDDMKLNQYMKRGNELKLKYFIFHELAHAYLNKEDRISNNLEIMNARIFNGDFPNAFNKKNETVMINELFKQYTQS